MVHKDAIPKSLKKISYSLGSSYIDLILTCKLISLLLNYGFALSH